METLVLENEYEIVVPLLVQHLMHQIKVNKSTTILYWFRSLYTVLSSTEKK